MPDEQALPALTATPARSSPMTSVSALVPGTAMQLVLGKRSTLPRQHHSLGHERESLRLKRIAKRGKLGARLAIRRGKLGRNAEADDAGDILGPRAPPPLLAAALDQGLDRDALARARERRHPSGRRSCGPKGSACRRRARRMSSGSLPAPEQRRYAEARRRRERARQPRRPAGSRRSRYLPPSAKRRPPTP